MEKGALWQGSGNHCSCFFAVPPVHHLLFRISNRNHFDEVTLFCCPKSPGPTVEALRGTGAALRILCGTSKHSLRWARSMERSCFLPEQAIRIVRPSEAVDCTNCRLHKLLKWLPPLIAFLHSPGRAQAEVSTWTRLPVPQKNGAPVGPLFYKGHASFSGVLEVGSSFLRFNPPARRPSAGNAASLDLSASLVPQKKAFQCPRPIGI